MNVLVVAMEPFVGEDTMDEDKDRKATLVVVRGSHVDGDVDELFVLVREHEVVGRGEFVVVLR